MKNDHLPAFGHSWQADALTKAKTDCQSRKRRTRIKNHKNTPPQSQQAHKCPCRDKDKVHHTPYTVQSKLRHQCSLHPKLKHTKTWVSQGIPPLPFSPLSSPPFHQSTTLWNLDTTLLHTHETHQNNQTPDHEFLLCSQSLHTIIRSPLKNNHKKNQSCH